jgi:hypothetical protein
MEASMDLSVEARLSPAGTGPPVRIAKAIATDAPLAMRFDTRMGSFVRALVRIVPPGRMGLLGSTGISGRFSPESSRGVGPDDLTNPPNAN